MNGKRIKLNRKFLKKGLNRKNHAITYQFWKLMIWAGKKGIKVKGFTYNTTSVIFADFPEPGITDLMYLANAIDFAMECHYIVCSVYVSPLLPSFGFRSSPPWSNYSEVQCRKWHQKQILK
jgi:hypothetical protein